MCKDLWECVRTSGNVCKDLWECVRISGNVCNDLWECVMTSGNVQGPLGMCKDFWECASTSVNVQGCQSSSKKNITQNKFIHGKFSRQLGRKETDVRNLNNMGKVKCV